MFAPEDSQTLIKIGGDWDVAPLRSLAQDADEKPLTIDVLWSYLTALR